MYSSYCHTLTQAEVLVDESTQQEELLAELKNHLETEKEKNKMLRDEMEEKVLSSYVQYSVVNTNNYREYTF